VNRAVLFVIAFEVCLGVAVLGADGPPSPYAKWTHGPSTDPKFFPIAVWLQDPRNAEKYRAIGINTYDGLWAGPTDEQLAALAKAGMRVICDQNATALHHLDDPTIIGWLQADEPDNAQELPNHGGYGPPIPPQRIIDQYRALKQADPTRPVLLGLGQAVAWNDYYGRGVRSGHAEDYPEYIQGADIISYDIYPMNDESPKVAGKLWYVARGVDHLVQMAKGEKTVWNCIECTHIGAPGRKPTPQEMRAEVWMSLIHGSHGIIWFVHQFAPNFIEAGLLADPEMTAAVTAINRQITELAPVLNSPTIPNGAKAELDATQMPMVDFMVKKMAGMTYLFAVETQGGATEIKFRLPDRRGGERVEVVGERRTLNAEGGVFTDAFEPYDVHIYRLKN
jgi:hypothetical protein